MKAEINIEEEKVYDAIANLIVKKIGIDKIKSEVVKNLTSQIKSDILGSDDTKRKIDMAVKTATVTMSGRINQKGEELLRGKLDELSNRKFTFSID